MANALATLMVKVGADISDMQSGLASVQRSLQDTGKRMTDLGKTLSTRLTAPITAFGALSVRAFGQQEDAERKLASAIRATGGEVDANMRRFTAFATEMQRLTVVGDETTLGLLQLATAQGLSADSAERAVKNAISMQSAFGVGAESAIRMTAALEQGDATMLRRYIPALRGVEDSTEAVAKAHEILSGAFDIAKEEAQTTTGQIAQLRNAFGDFMEQIGGVIAEALLPLIARLREGVEMLQNMDKATLRTSVAIAGLLAGIGPVVYALGLMAKAIAVILSPLALKIAALAALAAGINYVAQNAGAFADRFVHYFNLAKNAVLDMVSSGINALGRLVMYLDVSLGASIMGVSASVDGLKSELSDPSGFREFGSFTESITATLELARGGMVRLIDALGLDFSFGSLQGASNEANNLATGLERARVNAISLGSASAVSFEQVATGAEQSFSPIFSMGSYMADILTPVVNNFTASFGSGMANVVVQGEKLTDTLRNIGRLLASSAIQTGLQLLLTGGLSLAGAGFFGSGGGLFGRIFGTTFLNDGLVTSSGNIVKFHPNDNILAMKDFGNLSSQLQPTSGLTAQELTQALNGINWQLRGDTLYAVGTRGGVRYER